MFFALLGLAGIARADETCAFKWDVSREHALFQQGAAALAAGRDAWTAPAEFGGRPGCGTPHKVVEFALPAEQDLLLEFSNGEGAQVRYSVTAIAPPH